MVIMLPLKGLSPGYMSFTCRFLSFTYISYIWLTVTVTFTSTDIFFHTQLILYGGDHNNLVPYTVVVFCISINGLRPGRKMKTGGRELSTFSMLSRICHTCFSH